MKTSRNGTPPGFVRIIAGRWRRSKIPVPPVPGCRPTGARARETLFNWLHHHLPDATCLDLFAGTGILGLEALSRGAGHVTFVERHPQLVTALRSNCERFDAEHTIIQSDAARHLAKGNQYDIIFLDPPFEQQTMAHYLNLLLTHNNCKPHTMVYFEQSRFEPWPELLGWTIHKQAHSGDVRYGVLCSTSTI